MEEVALRLNLDVLFDKDGLRDIAKDDVLRILRQHCELIRDPCWFLCLFFLQLGFKFLSRRAHNELHVRRSLSHKLISWSDVAFSDLLKSFKGLLTADLQS